MIWGYKGIRVWGYKGIQEDPHAESAEGKKDNEEQDNKIAYRLY